MGASTFDALDSVPEPEVPTSRLRGLVTEWRFPLQLARLTLAAPNLARAGRGEGRVAILIPGWRASELTMEPLRRFLVGRGHDARHWGLGTNEGQPERDAHRLFERLPDEPVALVGWSLGGVIAREIARERPDRVRRVLTYGTPVVGGPSYTLAARAWTEEEARRIAAQVAQRDADKPLQVPVTAMFSRRDRVVHWAACIDRSNEVVEHVEVGSSHAGMGVDPDVWRVVAERLVADQ